MSYGTPTIRKFSIPTVVNDLNRDARLCDDGTARWVEVCFCADPLAEERASWEEFFELEKVQDAHPRRKCRDETGEEPWACSGCDCTEKLEGVMGGWGEPFLEALRRADRASRRCTPGASPVRHVD